MEPTRAIKDLRDYLTYTKDGEKKRECPLLRPVPRPPRLRSRARRLVQLLNSVVPLTPYWGEKTWCLTALRFTGSLKKTTFVREKVEEKLSTSL